MATEIKYAPTEGEYSKYQVILKNSVSISVKDKLDKASAYVAPAKVTTTLDGLGLNNAKFYIL